jgi:hypothetical protein
MEENRNTLKKSDDFWLCLKIAIGCYSCCQVVTFFTCDNFLPPASTYIPSKGGKNR